MEDNLMMAVLAMNAYDFPNQLGIGRGSAIGNAAVMKDASGEAVKSEVGAFAAYAYSYNGQTVISFRGTDGVSDVLSGWTGGLGFLSTQAFQAIQFYKAVVEGDANSQTAF